MRVRTPLWYVTVVAISACGLGFELVLGAVSTYMLGETITQFATIVGAYLFAMGIGAYATRHADAAGDALVHCQLAAALVGGLSAPALHVAFAACHDIRLVVYPLVVLTGVFVGAELPLVMRVLRRRVALRDLVARALTVDYAGALLGSLVAGLVLLPRLGLVRAGLVFGLANAVAAAWTVRLLGPTAHARPHYARAGIVVAALLAAMVVSDHFVSVADAALFTDPVVLTRQTEYQRIVITRGKTGASLFLDGNLQLAEFDEYRYHEALVHPALASAPRRARVLVLGGGDGLAAREILKYPDVEEITLVELDPAMIDLARTLPWLREANGGSLDSPKVHVVNADALVWLAEASPRPPPFDAAVVDFPDPNDFALGKLYTVRFYKLLRAMLAGDARVVVQSTSPLAARRSFWCIARSIEAAGFAVRPYHAAVPSFGEWGYVLASPRPFDPPAHVMPGLRFLDDATLASLFAMPPDMREVPAEPNRLNEQTLVRYYEDEIQR